MKKITTQRSIELMKDQPAFFESLRLNYGSFAKAGKKLHVSGKLLEKYATAKRRRLIPDSEQKRMIKALNRIPKSKRIVAESYLYSHDMATPAQRRFMLSYARKGEKQRRYIRKQINAAAGEQRRLIMPAMNESGEVKVYQNSPKTKRISRKRYTAEQRHKWPSSQKPHRKRISSR